jgi:uridine phosphorylase
MFTLHIHLCLDFPRTADGRVYHLGLKAGEVANRLVCFRVSHRTWVTHLEANYRPYGQITVGTPSRAEAIAAHFDAAPSTFRLMSERGFLTLTGRYHGVPVSVVAIGMGYPNVDFFIREVRESVSGDMIVIR